MILDLTQSLKDAKRKKLSVFAALPLCVEEE